jgi:hypothetical protein
MRHLSVFSMLMFFAITPLYAFGTEPELQCNIGPINKLYGNTAWLVYSCNDNETVVFVSAPGNPAMPFYFTYGKKDGSYNLWGEGTGNREATAAAATELKNLSEIEIEKLITDTNNT